MKYRTLKKLIFIFFINTVLFMSCQGFIYRKHTEPGMMGSAENINDVRACVRSYFFIVTTGNATMDEVRKKGKITKIASIDHEFTEILLGLIFRRYCILVSGE